MLMKGAKLQRQRLWKVVSRISLMMMTAWW
jgi:hypothetical protein